MSASVISFEEKLASIVKMGELAYDGERFTFKPSTNLGYHVFRLKKGYVRVNQSIVGLVDGLFAHLTNTTQEDLLPVNA